MVSVMKYSRRVLGQSDRLQEVNKELNQDGPISDTASIKYPLQGFMVWS